MPKTRSLRPADGAPTPLLPSLPSPARSFHWREQCHKCGIAKADGGQEIPAEVIASMQASTGYGAGGGGGYGGGYADPYGYGGGYGGGYTSADPGMQRNMQLKPGDWRCPACYNVK